MLSVSQRIDAMSCKVKLSECQINKRDVGLQSGFINMYVLKITLH